jgi:hypothetical protein
MQHTPASWPSYCIPVYSARAPPCEKPPTTIRESGMPLATSRSINAVTISRADSMPSHSWLARSSRLVMSYQLGIAMPMLRVTGCTGAFGRMNLTCCCDDRWS